MKNEKIYTGKKDKNGVKIFKRDIIPIKDCQQIGLFEVKKIYKKWWTELLNFKDKEVVGNVEEFKIID